MKIQIKVQTTAGKKAVRVGDVIELPDAEASFLIGAGYAIKSTAPLKSVDKDGKPVKAAAPVPPKSENKESKPDQEGK